MITLQNNPVVGSPSQPYFISFAMTRDTLLDTDIYSRFIYNIELAFRRSILYKIYKASLFNLGIDRDQMMAGITAEMADLELHHNFLELKYATIMIIEHLLNTKGCCTSFEVVHELKEAHRRNEFCPIFLSKTNHKNYHSNPNSFISLKQCITGNPFAFIERYMDGMTLDIAFKLLLKLKQEEQYGESFTPNMSKCREELLSWANYNTQIKG